MPKRTVFYYVLPLLFIAGCAFGTPAQPTIDAQGDPVSPLVMPSATPSPTAVAPLVSVITTTGGVNVVGVAADSLPVTVVVGNTVVPGATALAGETPTAHPYVTPRPPATPDWTPGVTPAPETIWYLLSPTVPAGPSMPDGRTVQTAWRYPEQIRWDLMKPWDELQVGSGFHRGTLRPATDYVQIKPIAGATGAIYFSGGRSADLPECHQAEWGVNDLGDDYGIWIEGVTGVVIDGGPQRLIHVRDYRYGGIRLEPSSRGVHLRNMRIYENGTGVQTATGWRPSRPGIVVGGRDHTLGPGLVIRDNGEDSVQSRWGDNNLSGLLVIGNWLYNGREHSSGNGQASNYCTHTDGVQVYSGGKVLNVMVANNVIGPRKTNGVILGDKGTGASVDYAIVTDNRFLLVSDNAVLDNSPDEVDVVGWNVARNVVFE